MSQLVYILAGCFTGLGAWLVVLGIRQKRVVSFSAAKARLEFKNSLNSQNLQRLMLGLGVGAAVWILTGIFVAGLLLGMGVGLFRNRMGSKRQMRESVAKSEAIASWAEMLYSILLAGGSIEKSIVTSAEIAPAAIRPEVKRLAKKLKTQNMPDALQAFGEEMHNPISDKIVAALSLSVTRGAQELVEMLRAQAESTRANSQIILEQEAGKSRHRTSAMIVMGVTLTVAAGLYVFEQGYLDPYKSFPGYLVLFVVGLGFMLGFGLLIRMGRAIEPQRYFEFSASSPEQTELQNTAEALQ